MSRGCPGCYWNTVKLSSAHKYQTFECSRAGPDIKMLFATKKLCALSKKDYGILGVGHKYIITQTKQFYDFSRNTVRSNIRKAARH